MKKLYAAIKKSYNKEIDGRGLALFRIFYSLVLLGEISYLIYFKQLVFDPMPFAQEAEINFYFPLGIWLISVILLLFGLFTRMATIINYLMTVVVVGTLATFEYHVYYAYLGINFLLMFAPVSQSISLDRLRKKLVFSNTTFQYNPPQTVPQFFYFLFPFVAIALVYFDSIFYKLGSHMWLDGLGVWEPSSLPFGTHVNTSALLNNEFLVKFLNWLTIIFETVFIFLFFRKKWRLPLFIVGLGLHLGILIQFPIPFFALAVIAVYLLLIPVSFWKKIFKKDHQKNATLDFYYDKDCPLCVRTKLIISHLDVQQKINFKMVQFEARNEKKLDEISEEELLDNIYSVSKKSGKVFKGIDTYIQVFLRIFYLFPIGVLLQIPGIYHIGKAVYNYVAVNRNTTRCTDENCGYNPPNIPIDKDFKVLQNVTLKDLKLFGFIILLSFLTLLQFGYVYQGKLSIDFKKKIGYYNSSIDKGINKLVNSYSYLSRSLIGVTKHPVFNHTHFDHYNHDISVVYNSQGKEEWLPIIDEKGMPDFYIYGCNWVNYTFRVNNPNINQKKLEYNLERYIRFWAGKNNIPLKNQTFIIKVKKIDDVKGWEKDFLNHQISHPWMNAGTYLWENGELKVSLKEIESI